MPFENFADSKTWLVHMEAEHKKKIAQWTCSVGKHGRIKFETQSDFEAHVRKAHEKLATESQLPIIIKRSGGPASEMFKCCPLCTWKPEPDVNPVYSASDMESKGMTYADIRHAQDARKQKLQQHIAEHMQLIALRALPDILFDSSEKSVRSRSSASSLSNDSRTSILSISQNEIQLLRKQKVPSIDDYSIDDTEDEDWAWVYRQLSLNTLIKPRGFDKPCESRHILVVYASVP